MNHRVAVIIITNILLITNVFAGREEYGLIKSVISSDGAVVYLKHGDKLIPAKEGTTIYIGDTLTSEASDYKVKYCNHSNDCKWAERGMLFSHDQRSNTQFNQVMRWLGLPIEDTVAKYADNAVTKGSGDNNLAQYKPAVYLAGMTEVTQDMFAGKRALTFQWRHGAAPFTIRIKQGQKLIFRGKTKLQHIQTKLLNLTPNKYQISITDNHEGTESILFNVIKSPPFAQQLLTFLSAEKDNNLKHYTQLGTLAMVDEGRYALEAYQQLLLINARSSQLTHLKKAIEAGDVFPELKSEDVIKRFQEIKE